MLHSSRFEESVADAVAATPTARAHHTAPRSAQTQWQRVTKELDLVEQEYANSQEADGLPSVAALRTLRMRLSSLRRKNQEEPLEPCAEQQNTAKNNHKTIESLLMDIARDMEEHHDEQGRKTAAQMAAAEPPRQTYMAGHGRALSKEKKLAMRQRQYIAQGTYSEGALSSPAEAAEGPAGELMVALSMDKLLRELETKLLAVPNWPRDGAKTAKIGAALLTLSWGREPATNIVAMLEDMWKSADKKAANLTPTQLLIQAWTSLALLVAIAFGEEAAAATRTALVSLLTLSQAGAAEAEIRFLSTAYVNDVQHRGGECLMEGGEPPQHSFIRSLQDSGWMTRVNAVLTTVSGRDATPAAAAAAASSAQPGSRGRTSRTGTAAEALKFAFPRIQLSKLKAGASLACLLHILSPGFCSTNGVKCGRKLTHLTKTDKEWVKQIDLRELGLADDTSVAALAKLRAEAAPKLAQYLVEQRSRAATT